MFVADWFLLCYYLKMNTIAIPKRITKGEELVIISRREYDRFLAVISGKGKVGNEDVLRWSREAKKLKKAGKLPLLSSLKNLL